jgi:hypothetical protein
MLSSLPGDVKQELSRFKFKGVLDELSTKLRHLRKTDIYYDGSYPLILRGYDIDKDGEIYATYHADYGYARTFTGVYVYNSNGGDLTDVFYPSRMYNSLKFSAYNSCNQRNWKYVVSRFFFTSYKEAYLVKEKLEAVMNLNEQLDDSLHTGLITQEKCEEIVATIKKLAYMSN